MSGVKSILLVGVGGQGTILTSGILAAGLLAEGHDVKMSEIHGMSQRGGSVTTQVKYGARVYAPSIAPGEADLIVSFEKVEALRWLPYLKPAGALVADDHEIHPLPAAIGAARYPEGVIEELRRQVENILVVPAGRIAAGLGNVRVQNIVLLGALVRTLKLDQADWPALVARRVPPKVKDLNLKAFEAGRLYQV